MMRLPEIKYSKKKGGAIRQQEIAFGGLDYTPGARSGALRECTNMSTRRYPVLSPRRGRDLFRDNGASSIFEWDGKLVQIIGNGVYYNDVLIDTVTPGEKQFCVVNTKLCIFPDKVYIDLTNNTLGHLDAEVSTTGQVNSVTMTDSSITAALHRILEKDVSGSPYFVNTSGYQPLIYTYGTDKDALEACYVNSAWDLTALQTIEKLCGVFWNAGGAGTTLTAGMIIIPGSTVRDLVYAWNIFYSNRPDRSQYNGDGYYGVVTKVEIEYDSDEIPSYYVYYDLYQVGVSEALFSDKFKAGDAVDITGTLYGTCDVKKQIILSIDSVTNTMNFAAGTFTLPSGYDTSSTVVTVSRTVPDLDFICESGNRLWGVSNSQENEIYNQDTGKYDTFSSRCIYASALGDPTNFWIFEGLSTDAWQVAVGSEGDFTAICRYDGVCCWKEKKLYRVAGSYPAEYYLSERDIEGVQTGSNKSIAILNEALIFKGVSGVYAYKGGTPTLLSSNFGTHRYTDAAAGSDGTKYYISMKEGTTWSLFVYDALTGLWMREDNAEAVDFCLLGGKLLMLDSDGRVLQLDYNDWEDPTADGEDYEPVSWSAVFAPFDERDAHERKKYLRILLRVSVSTGGSISVYVSKGGTYNLLQTLTPGAHMAVIPVYPNRIDELKIKLTGTAPAEVLSLAREFTVGSIYGEEAAAK